MDGPGKVEEYERFFVTPQHVDLSALCKAYGISYRKACNPKELEQAEVEELGDWMGYALIE